MYTAEQHAELTRLIDEQFAKLGNQLVNPMQPGDTVFVTGALPSWLEPAREHWFVVVWPKGKDESTRQFLLRMDIHFAGYHRSMELIGGSPEELHRFATQNPPSAQVADAICELMAIERQGS